MVKIRENLKSWLVDRYAVVFKSDIKFLLKTRFMINHVLGNNLCLINVNKPSGVLINANLTHGGQIFQQIVISDTEARSELNNRAFYGR